MKRYSSQSCGDSTPALQLQKYIFDKVSETIEVPIVRAKILRLFLGGMTGWTPAASRELTSVSLSYPLSARRYSAVIPSISLQACEQSATVPTVTNILTGIPCASTARCIFELRPLLCAPYPDCRHVRPQHVDVS